MSVLVESLPVTPIIIDGPLKREYDAPEVGVMRKEECGEDYVLIDGGSCVSRTNSPALTDTDSESVATTDGVDSSSMAGAEADSKSSLDAVEVGLIDGDEQPMISESSVAEATEVSNEASTEGSDIATSNQQQASVEDSSESEESAQSCQPTEETAATTTTSDDATSTSAVASSPTSQNEEPQKFQKGQRVVYRNASTGVSEEMIVVGVHYDDFPNIYYTVQQVEPGEDGVRKERQTYASRLVLVDVQSAEPKSANHADDAAPLGSATQPSASSATGGVKKVPVTLGAKEAQSNTAAEARAEPQQPPRKQQHQQFRQQQQQQQQHQQHQQQRPFDIYVSLGSSREYVLSDITPNTTVNEIKAIIAHELGRSVRIINSLQFVYRNRLINNGKLTMRELGIARGSHIAVVPAMYY